MRGLRGGLLIALGCHTLATIVPGLLLIGSSVSAGWRFLSAPTAFPAPAWRLSFVVHSMSLSYPFHILLTEICLEDIFQDQKRFPPEGQNRGTFIHRLLRAASSLHVVHTGVLRLKARLSLHMRLRVAS